MGQVPVTADSGCQNKKTTTEHQTSQYLSGQGRNFREIQGLKESDEMGLPLDWATVLV